MDKPQIYLAIWRGRSAPDSLFIWNEKRSKAATDAAAHFGCAMWIGQLNIAI